MKNKKDKPFFEKFNSQSVFFNSDKDFYNSIVSEITSILSSRLKWKDEYLKFSCNPYSYGIKDFQFIETSPEFVEEFKLHLKEMILTNEPRISNIEINDIRIKKEPQTLALDIIVAIKNDNFETKLTVGFL
ncbi:MAG: GPW/gp25 family protein [Holosporales bacterium]|jgi:predicted component of type VI protein secretion system|nr:GPW/gp25 family protein [Holosporales bacterium]